MKIFENIKFVLGSKSPRRSQLLKEAGFDFEIRYQDADESFDMALPPLEVAALLAVRKAEALQNTLLHDEILITADSVVILDDTIYNKPENEAAATIMLATLAGKTHRVATGVCIASHEKMTSFTTLTDVVFDTINDEEIKYYIDHYKPLDKAGSYGIQDWIGLCKVKEIRGSYSNVMGLPIREVYQALVTFIGEKTM